MHHLRDFKNFERAALNLFAPLTILLGRNGSGKTNLIEGVELLGALARGVPFTDITETGRGGVLEIRGGLASCPRFGTSEFTLGLDRASVSSLDGHRANVLYWIKIQMAKSGVQLAAEGLRVKDRVLFRAENRPSGVVTLTYDSDDSPPRTHRRQASGSSSILSRYREIFIDGRPPTPKLLEPGHAVSQVMNYLQRAYIFDPNPKLMRGYERVDPQAQLTRSGSNLSAVLFALDNGPADKKATLDRITKTIRQIPEEPFLKIGFAETSLGDVMAGFEAKHYRRPNGSSLVEARLLSDGTLRMLAVLTALETVPEPSRIVIEEFDNGMHPSRAAVLIQYLTEIATRRRLNLVLTTHNPAFMNALADDQLQSVWICHRDDTKNASRVTRFADLDTAVTLGLGGGLGDYVARGALEKRLASNYKEAKRKAIQRWIESVS